VSTVAERDRTHVVKWKDRRTGSIGTSAPLALQAAEGYAKILKSIGHKTRIELKQGKKP
jgi:hypothetical protein